MECRVWRQSAAHIPSIEGFLCRMLCAIRLLPTRCGWLRLGPLLLASSLPLLPFWLRLLLC